MARKKSGDFRKRYLLTEKKRTTGEAELQMRAGLRLTCADTHSVASRTSWRTISKIPINAYPLLPAPPLSQYCS